MKSIYLLSIFLIPVCITDRQNGDLMMITVHISDIHFEKNSPLSTALTEKIVNTVNALETPVDAVLISGDTSQAKQYDNYEGCFKILDKLKAPYFVITGNHDRSQDLIKALKQYCPRHPESEFGDCLQYCVDDFEMRLIALDTFADNKAGGCFPAERLKWLEDKLENNPDKKPVIILIHQFTAKTGLNFFDTHAGAWFDDFNRLAARHEDTIKLIACGHMHNAMSTTIGRIPVVCCFSAKWQAKLDFKPENDLVLPRKPVGFYLHRFEDGKLVSIAVPLEKV